MAIGAATAALGIGLAGAAVAKPPETAPEAVIRCASELTTSAAESVERAAAATASATSAAPTAAKDAAEDAADRVNRAGQALSTPASLF